MTLKANELAALLISQFLHPSSGRQKPHSHCTITDSPRPEQGPHLSQCHDPSTQTQTDSTVGPQGTSSVSRASVSQFPPVSLKVAPAGLVVRKKGGPRSWNGGGSVGHIPLQAHKVSLVPRSSVPARLNRLGSSCLRGHCWPCLTGTHGLSMPSLFSTHHDHKGRAVQPSLPQHTLVPSAMTFILTPDRHRGCS